MGAWGVGNFENDIALDWVHELEEFDNLSLIDKVISDALEEEYLDSDLGCEVLAAVETVARLLGNFGGNSSDNKDIDNWVRTHTFKVSTKLLENSKKVLKHVLSDKSELKELWEETEDYQEWLAEVTNLEKRIK